MREKLQLIGTASWTRDTKSLRTTTLSDRVMDIIDLGHAALSKANPEGDLRHFYIDTSQSATRAPWVHKHLRAVTTSTDLFSFGRQRYLSAEELFRALGFEALNLKHISPTSQKDLLGEAMSIPCVGTVFACLVLSVPALWAAEGECGGIA